MKGSLYLPETLGISRILLIFPNLGGEAALKEGVWKKKHPSIKWLRRFDKHCACWESRLLLESFMAGKLKHCSSPFSLSLWQAVVLHPLTC